MLSKLINVKKMAENDLDNLDKINKQKSVKNIPISDEIKAITNLDTERIDKKEFMKEIEKTVKHFEGDFLPKLVIKNDFYNLVNYQLSEIPNCIKVILPKNSEDIIDITAISDNMDTLSINTNFLWFQQNSNNVYKMNLNDSDWILIENKDNYKLQEMFRVCIINAEEALITGK
jgi:hypothetical protein